MHHPLDFENSPTIQTLVEFGSFISANVETLLNRIKQKSPATPSKWMIFTIFENNKRMLSQKNHQQQPDSFLIIDMKLLQKIT